MCDTVGVGLTPQPGLSLVLRVFWVSNTDKRLHCGCPWGLLLSLFHTAGVVKGLPARLVRSLCPLDKVPALLQTHPLANSGHLPEIDLLSLPCLL